MRLFLIVLLVINTPLLAQEQFGNDQLLRNRSAVVYFTMNEPMKGKTINQMKIYALSDRYLLIDKTYNAGSSDNLDTSKYGYGKLLQNITRKGRKKSSFSYMAHPFYADSVGTVLPEHDVHYGGETYTNVDSSKMIIAYKIKGDFLITSDDEYRGLKKLFCFENNYKPQTAIPIIVKQVNKLSKKDARKLMLTKLPMGGYIFVDCD